MWACSIFNAAASILFSLRFTKSRGGFVYPNLTIIHTSPSLKSFGLSITLSILSWVPQSCLSRNIFLMSFNNASGIMVVSPSIAYTSICSCFARFPTRASFRASAYLYPFTKKLAATGHTLVAVIVCCLHLDVPASFSESRHRKHEDFVHADSLSPTHHANMGHDQKEVEASPQQ